MYKHWWWKSEFFFCITDANVQITKEKKRNLFHPVLVHKAEALMKFRTLILHLPLAF